MGILAGDLQATMVNDISLDICLGEFVSISGPSGSGKSSLLYLLRLLDKPSAGSIILATHDPAFAQKAFKQVYVVDGKLVDISTHSPS